MASLPPRPKPWETQSSQQTQPQGSGSNTTYPTSSFDNAVASSSAAPRLPDRPTGLAEASTSTLTPYQPRITPSYSSPYGGVGGYGSYSSPFSRGMYGGAYGGGYGGYGGYGGGYGMGYGVGGMGVPGEGYPNLTSSLQASTAPAFQVIESLVAAFTSLAQLFESTYMATHSSFFAMVGVADQLGSLKTYLGQVLGVFSVLRLGRRILNWLRGKGVRTDGWAEEWSRAGTGIGVGGPGAGQAPKPSSKPLILFLLSAIGLPWLMSRLVKLLIANQSQSNPALQAAEGIPGAGPGSAPLDPSKLQFARAKWEFRATENWELSLSADEIVAVIETRDTPQGTGWWRGRTRDGRVGWFPGNYVELIRRRDQPVAEAKVESAPPTEFEPSVQGDR